MRLENLIEAFIDTFPEFKKASLKFIEEQGGDPGEYVFFGYVLNPFLKENLPEMKDRQLFIRIFNFLESMAVSDDDRIRHVLAWGVLEELGDDPEKLKAAWPLMGKGTRRLSDRAEWYWGRTL